MADKKIEGSNPAVPNVEGRRFPRRRNQAFLGATERTTRIPTGPGDESNGDGNATIPIRANAPGYDAHHANDGRTGVVTGAHVQRFVATRGGRTM